MNNTNRGANRLLILVTGVISLIIGATGVALGTWPAFKSGWRSDAPSILRHTAHLFTSTAIGTTTVSWLSLAAIVTALLFGILFVLFLTRHGRGRTGNLIRSTSNGHGGVAVRAAFAEQAMQNYLDDRPELVSSHVSTYDVRGAPVLKITATCRRGISPVDVAATVDEGLKALDALLGQRALAYLQLGGGFRARLSKPSRIS